MDLLNYMDNTSKLTDNLSYILKVMHIYIYIIKINTIFSLNKISIFVIS